MVACCVNTSFLQLHVMVSNKSWLPLAFSVLVASEMPKNKEKYERSKTNVYNISALTWRKYYKGPEFHGPQALVTQSGES